MPKQRKNTNVGTTSLGKWTDTNIAGSIYFTIAYSEELAAKGFVKMKIGISNCDQKAALNHAQTGTTYSGDHYDVLACVPVDENTYIPTLTGEGERCELGGVLEMEQYLHGVFGEFFRKQGGKLKSFNMYPFMQCIHKKSRLTGELQQCGKEWFYAPIEMIDLILQAKQKGIEVGGDLWNVCPPVARCIYFAPKYEQVPSFRKDRQKKIDKVWKVNTQRVNDLKKTQSDRDRARRTRAMQLQDLYCVREYSRKYMLT